MAKKSVSGGGGNKYCVFCIKKRILWNPTEQECCLCGYENDHPGQILTSHKIDNKSEKGSSYLFFLFFVQQQKLIFKANFFFFRKGDVDQPKTT
jgi:hypothetical protein